MKKLHLLPAVLALLCTMPVAMALAAPKPAPAEAMKKLAVLRETVDFAHAPRANSFVDFSRAAFNDGVDKVTVNGLENRFHRYGVTVSLRPQKGWNEGLNTVTVAANGKLYTMYVSHHKSIPTVSDYTGKISLLNGKPFTPLAIYAVDIEQIKDAKKFGFNVFHNYTMTRLGDAYPMQEFLDTLQKENCYGMIHLQHTEIAASNFKPVMERVVRYMNHPALCWWYLFDEPGIYGVDPEQLVFFNDMVRKLDPYHTTVSSSWYQKEFQDSVDVDIPQWYHGHAAGMAKTAKEYAEKAAGEWHDMQSLPILNTHDSAFGCESGGSLNPNSFYDEEVNGKKRGDYPKDSPEYQDAEKRALALVNDPDHPHRPPTPTYPGSIERMRGQVTTSILSGANGLIYWLYSDRRMNPRWGIYTVFSPTKNRAEFTQVMREVKAFAPYFNGFAANTKVERGDELWYGCRTVDGKFILMLSNVSGRQLDGVLELPGAPARLYVNNGDETVRLSDGRLRYSLKADEGRIYCSEPIR
ncbi:hypothetical protein [Victivallis vadensis]|uniref:hypothetical protein n=1 Tax=Victivallis vadensis TaxID=172901 RepID=UPI0023F0BD4A|nr:hypothetical protein [Victivallis vadensis]